MKTYSVIAHCSIQHKVELLLRHDKNLHDRSKTRVFLVQSAFEHIVSETLEVLDNQVMNYKPSIVIVVFCRLNRASCKVVTALEMSYLHKNHILFVSTDGDLVDRYMRDCSTTVSFALRMRFQRARGDDSDDSDCGSDSGDERCDQITRTHLGQLPSDCILTLLAYNTIDLWPALTCVNKHFFSIVDENIWRRYYEELTGEETEDYTDESFMRRCMQLSYVFSNSFKGREDVIIPSSLLKDLRRNSQSETLSIVDEWRQRSSHTSDYIHHFTLEFL